MKRHSSLLTAVLCAAAAAAQPVFTDHSANLSHAASSGTCIGVTDMDGDGLDDIVQLDMSTHVYVLYQNPDHTFITYDYGTVDSGSEWGWAIADLDNDGHKDICSGVSVTRYLHITGRGQYTLTNLDGPTIFTQCMSMADMNNDGRVDVFACNDVGPSNIWITNGSGTPVYSANFMNWATTCTGLIDPSDGDMSGNYSSTFTDFDNDGDIDLHIAHCRQGVNNPDDCRRWDRLFVNDGNGNYSDQAANFGLESHEQDWTTDFGDYDNDGDLDAFSTTHSTTLLLYENDGTGHYTNVTAGSGLENSTGFFLAGMFRDLDNDGFLDILTGSAYHYFKGNGNGTFTELNNVFPASKQMRTFAFGDFNADGFEDVYAGYGDGYIDGDPSFPDRLWMNTPNGNHWLNVRLQGVQSNRDAVGARVTLTGPWGTMIREVHAGENYGTVNTFSCHFGLGTNTTIPTLTIHWPSGQVDTYTDLDADQDITMIEGTCIAPVASITAPTNIVCTGGAPLTLTANPGFNYTWSNGPTTQSVDITTGGTYTVTIDAGNNCTDEASFTVVADPDETPTITLSGDATICAGSFVTLTSSAASGYTWSTSAHGQSIDAATAGSYTVTIDGTCGPFTSAPVQVDVLPAPDAPGSSGTSIAIGATADLNATGSHVVWYDAASGGNLVATGNAWTTPALFTNTSYWCADQTIYGGDTIHGAQTDNTASGQYSNSANYLIFDANEDFTLKSVKVYASAAGNRTIALKDDNGVTLGSGVFNIPAGQSRVQLDFNVPQGGPYGLMVTSGNPQLWRDGQGSNPAYPFQIGTLATITMSSAGGANALQYYYFFYDWEVTSAMTACEGPRTEVDVLVGPQGISEANTSGVSVYPVPASSALTVDFGKLSGNVGIELIDVTGRTVLSRSAAINGTMTLDLSSIARGQYQLRLLLAGGSTTRRVELR